MSASRSGWNRRELLAGGLSSVLLGRCSRSERPVRIVGEQHAEGHRLRTGDFPPVQGSETVETLILGGGVAGCTAAYALAKAGLQDFRILELADDPGGNSRSGFSSVSAFPWGAHYLPQPDRNQVELLEFLQECGAQIGWSPEGSPIFHQDYLCHEPEDRLFFQGGWHEGLIPWSSLPAGDVRDLRQFFAWIGELAALRGSDGRPIFTIPLDQSSRDPQWLRLDQMTFASCLRGKGWHSPFLAWYADYCCRDDYGSSWEHVSAWAGLHYFVARFRDSSESQEVLTWPEGNSWLIGKLLRNCSKQFSGGQLIYAIERSKDGFKVISYCGREGISRQWLASSLIVALPRFIASRLLPEAGLPTLDVSYAPWMVANCHVDHLPESNGYGLAWDNVPYGSASLGYVVATHQNIQRYQGPSVLTSYWPLAGASIPLQRMLAGTRQAQDWERIIVADLEMMHPGYESAINAIDIWLWGHGMVQPYPGFIWGSLRQSLAASQHKGLAFAHSDMSGISIFEEAFARGHAAARQVLKDKL